MRSGRLGAVDVMRGGGCVTSLARLWNVKGEMRLGMGTSPNAISGEEWSAAFDCTSEVRSGTAFLQHSSDFAVGAHLPLRQHSAAF